MSQEWLWILTVVVDLGFAIAVIDTPFIYMARRWKPPEETAA